MDSSVLVSEKQPPGQQALEGVGLHPVHPGRRQVHRGTPVKLCALSYSQGNVTERFAHRQAILGVRIQFQPRRRLPVINSLCRGTFLLCDGNTVGKCLLVIMIFSSLPDLTCPLALC